MTAGNIVDGSRWTPVLLLVALAAWTLLVWVIL